MPVLSARTVDLHLSASKPFRPKRSGKRRTAAAAVEFGFVAVLLGIVVGGMVELSHAITVKETLSNASRRGITAAIKGSPSYSAITSAVDDILATDQQLPATLANGKAHLVVTVATWNASTQTYGSDVKVTSSSFAPNQYDKVGVRVWVNASDVSLLFLSYMTGKIEGETIYMMKQ